MIRKIIRTCITTLISLIVFIIVGFAVYTGVILIWHKDANSIQNHDAIIVLTGGKGRIETGLTLLIDDKADRLLVSGVLDQVSKSDIINENTKEWDAKDIRSLRRHCCIDLDYAADTTATNATESKQWIDKNNVKSIILVTSDYHMPRSYLQFHAALDDDIIITAFPYHSNSAISNIASFQFWRYTASEYIKFGGSLIRIMNPSKDRS